MISEAIEELTGEQIEQIFGWADELVKEKGVVIKSHTFDWHTETVYRLAGYEGLDIEVGGTYSQYGGDDVKIWINPSEESIKPVYGVYRYGGGGIEVHGVVRTVTEWFPRIQPLVEKWWQAKQLAAEKWRRQQAQIRHYRPKAIEISEKNHPLNCLEYDLNRWPAELNNYQNIGAVPKSEKWQGATLRISSFDGNSIFVNHRHPDFEKWKSLSLTSSPQFEVSHKPRPYILPAWARYLRLK